MRVGRPHKLDESLTRLKIRDQILAPREEAKETEEAKEENATTCEEETDEF